MDVTIITEQGTHLLIARGDRFAVIERRNNRFYTRATGRIERPPRRLSTTSSPVVRGLPNACAEQWLAMH
jgi:hypothetical protein